MERMNSFSKALEVFQGSKPTDFARIPSEKYSSERMGGWILKDENDQHVGFASNYGDVSYFELVTTTPTTNHRRGK